MSGFKTFQNLALKIVQDAIEQVIQGSDDAGSTLGYSAAKGVIEELSKNGLFGRHALMNRTSIQNIIDDPKYQNADSKLPKEDDLYDVLHPFVKALDVAVDKLYPWDDDGFPASVKDKAISRALSDICDKIGPLWDSD